jgi:hypothetical protein
MKLSNKRVIKTLLGEYHRALETLNHIYFVNYNEGDENSNVLMYNRKMNLVSNNYFASVGLEEDLKSGEYVWIAPKLKKLYETNKEIW